MNTKSIPGTVGQKLRSPKTLLIGGLLLFFLVEPAAAQSGCSNTLVEDAIDILNQLTAILPIFGAIVFVYASWRYGVDQNNKSTYKKPRRIPDLRHLGAVARNGHPHGNHRIRAEHRRR